MLNSEKFFVRSNALKNADSFSMLDYVTSLVRNTELSRMQDKKSFKDGKETLEKDHPGIDIMTCDETLIYQSLKNDAGQFIKDRKEISDLTNECASCIPLENVTSLTITDRVHITLMAHAIYKNVLLDADIFDTEKGGVDISKSIKKYYTSGNMKDLKDDLRPVFNKLLGTEGEHFYAVKTKKSDFTEKDLRNFVAAFGGVAKRDSKKSGKEVVFGNYDYIDKSANKKVQIAAFTTLCAVVLDNASKHEVVKPEETKAE